MNASSKPPAIVILVRSQQIRSYLVNLLTEYHYQPLVVDNPDEAVQIIKKTRCATVFLDCGILQQYGVRMCSKIKPACQYCRIVLIGNRQPPAHRDIIREAMEIGIYACLFSPYVDWEVLTMVSHYPNR